ncbi:MAG: hypothetical protein ACRD30_04920, partial [Bryobacteraceae bacterium]
MRLAMTSKSSVAGFKPVLPIRRSSFTLKQLRCYPQFLMRTVDLIHRKRDGEELSTDEISFLVEGYTSGSIPDYQLSAFLMSVYFSGMTDRE